MSEMDRTERDSWRYIHGEMDAAEAADFERRLQADDGLRADVTTARDFHAQLRSAFSPAVPTQDDIADRILSEIGEPPDAALTAPLPNQDVPGSSHRRLAFRWAMGSLAAAALALIVILPQGKNGPIIWQKPQFQDLQYRGGTQEAAPRFSRRDALQCFHLLQASVDEQVDASALPARMGTHRLQFSFRERIDGTASVRVQHLDEEDEVLHEWLASSRGPEAFAQQVDTFAGHIVKDLMEGMPQL